MNASTATMARKKSALRMAKQNESLFKKFQEELRDHFGDDVWDNFLKQLQLVSINETTVTLSTATTFLAKNFVASYKKKSIGLWKTLLNRTVAVKVIVRESVGLHGWCSTHSGQIFGQAPTLSESIKIVPEPEPKLEPDDPMVSVAIRLTLAKAKVRSFPRMKPAFKVPKEILERIAEKVESEKQVIQVLDKVFNVWSLIDEIVSMSVLEKFIKEILKDDTSQNREPPGDISKLIRLVCAYFKISQKELVKKSKKRKVVRVRQIIMYLAKNLTSASLSQIGRSVGMKNHTTVLYGCGKIQSLIPKDKRIAKAVVVLSERFENLNG